MAGKGSKRRPQAVDADTMRRNWDRAFGKRCAYRRYCDCEPGGYSFEEHARDCDICDGDAMHNAALEAERDEG